MKPLCNFIGNITSTPEAGIINPYPADVEYRASY
jgi:hypothetical protein